MNGDQGTTRNNVFPNIPKENYHSQGIIFPSHSPFFLNTYLLIPYHSFFVEK